MDFIIYYFVSIVNCYISVLIIFDYFKTNFSLSYEKQLIYSFSSILIALIIGSINLLEIPILNFSSWIFLLSICICILFYDAWNGKKQLFYNLYFLLFALTFIETISTSLYELFVLAIVNIDVPNLTHTVIKMAISKTAIIFIYQLTKAKWLTRKKSDYIPKNQMILYILLTLCSIINMCLNAKISYFNYNVHDQVLGYLSIIIIVFINLYIMQIFDYIIENQKLKNKISLSEQQANLQLNYYKQLNANYQQSLRVLHDIDKHINILENLYKNHDYMRADNYLESIDKLISEFVLTSYTTHPVLNLILNEKKRIAEKNSTSFSCFIEHVDFNFMEDIDITTIFSNLLDNALTETLKYEQKGEIILTVNSHNNFIIINIKNTYLSPVSHIFPSEKYGIGLYNVENSVKKYGGTLKITSSNNFFDCNILLSNTSPNT